MNLLNASLLQDSIKFVIETKQNLFNKKENKEYSDIQGSTKTNNDTTEQHNEVF